MPNNLSKRMAEASESVIAVGDGAVRVAGHFTDKCGYDRCRDCSEQSAEYGRDEEGHSAGSVCWEKADRVNSHPAWSQRIDPNQWAKWRKWHALFMTLISADVRCCAGGG